MQNDRVAAFATLVTAVIFGGPGILLGLWVLMSIYPQELRFLWEFTAARWPALELTPISAEHRLISGAIALLLCIIGHHQVRRAQAAAVATKARLELGSGPRMDLVSGLPRIGDVLEGRIHLGEPTTSDKIYRIQLSCVRPGGASRDDDRPDYVLCQDIDVHPVRSGESWSLPFRFELPLTAPPSTPEGMVTTGYAWTLEYWTAGVQWYPTQFALQVAPAPAEKLHALEAGETAEQKAAFDAIERDVGGRAMLASERLQMRSLSPEDLAVARKTVALPRTIIKWLAIVGIGVPIAGFALVTAAAYIAQRLQ